jgi:hypothetical protein
MKKLTTTAALVSLALVLAACDEEASANSAACETYCANLLEGYRNDTRSSACTISDNEQKSFEERCEDSCHTALDFVVDSDVAKEARQCLSCIDGCLEADYLSQDVLAARNQTCAVECAKTGAKQFYATFYADAPQETCI